MILQERINTNETSAETQRFSIEANSVAFSILSGNIYTDRYRAIMRELATNAYDAHIAAGIPEKPIIIHLPDDDYLKLQIEDHGIGMSHSTVMTLYTTYFGSDKRESNDLVGALGLGSKSPFAQYQSFGVVTRTENETEGRQYIAMIDDTGSPSIAFVGHIKTHVGTKITIDVFADEIRTYHALATEVFNFFPVFPEIKSARLYDTDNLRNEFDWWKNNRRQMHDGTYYSIRTERYNARSKLRVVQGSVPYYVEVDSLGPIEKLNYLSISGRVTIEVPVGTVMPAASRESITLTPEAIDYLTKAMNNVITTAYSVYRLNVLMNSHTLQEFFKNNTGNFVNIEDFLNKRFPTLDHYRKQHHSNRFFPKLRNDGILFDNAATFINRPQLIRFRAATKKVFFQGYIVEWDDYNDKLKTVTNFSSSYLELNGATPSRKYYHCLYDERNVFKQRIRQTACENPDIQYVALYHPDDDPIPNSLTLFLKEFHGPDFEIIEFNRDDFPLPKRTRYSSGTKAPKKELAKNYTLIDGKIINHVYFQTERETYDREEMLELIESGTKIMSRHGDWALSDTSQSSARIAYDHSKYKILIGISNEGHEKRSNAYKKIKEYINHFEAEYLVMAMRRAKTYYTRAERFYGACAHRNNFDSPAIYAMYRIGKLKDMARRIEESGLYPHVATAYWLAQAGFELDIGCLKMDRYSAQVPEIIDPPPNKKYYNIDRAGSRIGRTLNRYLKTSTSQHLTDDFEYAYVVGRLQLAIEQKENV